MKIDFEDITWEMYCEYLGVPFFEPVDKKTKIIVDEKGIDIESFQINCEKKKDITKRWEYLYALEQAVITPEEDMEELERRRWYIDYLEYTMDKSKFLKSDFYAYLINKNRTELIEEMLDERKDG
jgi:hypothetical protein